MVLFEASDSTGWIPFIHAILLRIEVATMQSIQTFNKVNKRFAR